MVAVGVTIYAIRKDTLTVVYAKFIASSDYNRK